MTVSSQPIPLFNHHTSSFTPIDSTHDDEHTTQGSAEDEYLATVKRMHAKQDAWSRAARSASASASASESPSGSRSRSPSKAGNGQYGGAGGFSSGSIGDPSGSGGGQQKKSRKKVAKACLACQKSHVTCDDSEFDWYLEGATTVVLTLVFRTTVYTMCQKGDRSTMRRRCS